MVLVHIWYMCKGIEKNQLTLPKPVREKLGLKKGAKIDIFPYT